MHIDDALAGGASVTLENLPTYIEKGQELSDWTLLFYVSYVLVASFLIFNLFIGIVINSMEEARAIELHRAEAPDLRLHLGAALLHCAQEVEPRAVGHLDVEHGHVDARLHGRGDRHPVESLRGAWRPVQPLDRQRAGVPQADREARRPGPEPALLLVVPR